MPASLADLDISRLRLLAEQGRADAENELGTRYETGRGGVEKNTSQARDWYRRAAEQRHADAQYRLGFMYTDRWSSPLTDREAFQLFLDAARQGHPQAQYEVAVSFETGRGVDPDEPEAAYWYRRAAEREHEGALKKVLEIERLETQLHRMAEEGDPTAQYELAMRYQSSDSQEKRTAAVAWFRRAAEQGDARSEYELGFMYDNACRAVRVEDPVDPVDSTEAVRWYRRAAVRGHARAQARLGDLYTDGIGVGRDYAEALRWFRRAAEQQDAEGEFLLGCVYRQGRAIAPDNAEAVRWFRRAADQGHPDACYSLREMCKDGLWVDSEAVEWLRHRSHQEDDEDAMYVLGIMYRHGWGVWRSEAKAFSCFRRAAERGQYDAEREVANRPSLPRRVLDRVELVFGLVMIIGLVLAFSWGFGFGAQLLGEKVRDLLPPVWSAVVQCPDHVERLANYGFRWTDGLRELKLRLSQNVVADDPDVVTYVGDKIEYQNRYGVWERQVYGCDLDIITREVVDVRVTPGRLPL